MDGNPLKRFWCNFQRSITVLREGIWVSIWRERWWGGSKMSTISFGLPSLDPSHTEDGERKFCLCLWRIDAWRCSSKYDTIVGFAVQTDSWQSYRAAMLTLSLSVSMNQQQQSVHSSSCCEYLGVHISHDEVHFLWKVRRSHRPIEVCMHHCVLLSFFASNVEQQQLL